MNKNVNSLNTIFSDIREDLLSEKERSFIHNKNIGKNVTCPIIMIYIEGIEVNALLDTGSQVTVISDRFYNNNIDIFKKCPHLPLSGQVIKSAINEKSVPLKFQILCNSD